MSYQDEPDFARQVADLNKYGQALNRCETVEEVVSLTLEAMSILFGSAHSTFVEAREEDLRVVHSTNPLLTQEDRPSDAAYEAYETGETTVATGADARVSPEADTETALAVPARIVDEVTAVLVMRSASERSFDEAVVRPMEILASHAATAIGNIRSHERLERARQDLETRKDMIQLYDRLLRHDLGNDLQVIAGFANEVAENTEGQTGQYAERIRRSAESAADLVQRVGDLVSALEAQDEPEPRDLAAVLAESVAGVRTQHGDLAVSFDRSAFEYRVYGGELLDSVFTNLLSNAAGHNDGSVAVDLYAETTGSDEVIVGVADDGDGIAPEIREDLFEMGAKGPDSTGTGFGLGFVRALTDSYGGGVTVGESPEGGADFRVRLQRV